MFLADWSSWLSRIVYSTVQTAEPDKVVGSSPASVINIFVNESDNHDIWLLIFVSKYKFLFFLSFFLSLFARMGDRGK